MNYLIKGGRVICPKSGVDKIADLLIENGLIKTIKNTINSKDAQVIDAHGKIIMPGIVDIHTHMRIPGFEFKEDLLTGSNSALAGGITTAVCMPNTKPALDTPETIKALQNQIKVQSKINIKIISAITKGIAGNELADMKINHELGSVGFSDDGRTTMNEDYMMDAFQIADDCSVPVITHCEDHDKSDLYKDEPAPPELEHTIVKRDIDLCEKASGRLHICHISTKESVAYVKKAKAKGLNVTCEVAPHHFAMTQEEINPLDPYTKVNPPIRTSDHKEAIIKGIVDGTIDVIATDHAPHEKESKEGKTFREASFGITGFETSLALSYTHLVKAGHISINKLVEMMTARPAELLGLEGGTLSINSLADLIIVDIDTNYKIDSDTFFSKGKNTPFNGKKVSGKVTHTFVAGELKFKEGLLCQ